MSQNTYYYCINEEKINDFDYYCEYLSDWDPIENPLDSAEDAAKVAFDGMDEYLWPKNFWLKKDELSDPIGPIGVDCEPVPTFHAFDYDCD